MGQSFRVKLVKSVKNSNKDKLGIIGNILGGCKIEVSQLTHNPVCKTCDIFFWVCVYVPLHDFHADDVTRSVNIKK